MEEINWDNEEKYFEEADVEKRKDKLKEKIFEWCQKGDIYHLKKYMNDPMTDIEATDVNKWTPLIWGVVNNQIEVVRTILEKTHGVKEKTESISDSQLLDENAAEEEDKPKSKMQTIVVEEKSLEESFKKPANQRDCKYNPLHWATYKGNTLLTSILLKNKFNPLEIDMYGNTALHQGAASNNSQLFKLLMGLGYDLEMKNARNHTPLELTSNEEIKKLIKKSVDTAQCAICQKFFNFYVTKYLCFIKEEIVCKDCCVQSYYYLTDKDLKKDVFECRCKRCYEEIEEDEMKINEVIAKNELNSVVDCYEMCKEKKINPKLRVLVLQTIDRLQRKKKIKGYIDSLEKVENHKTIEKSLFLLLSELDEAKKLGIHIDENLVGNVEFQNMRKRAERDLRKLLSNKTVFDSSHELRDEIEMNLKNSIDTKVDQCFIDEAMKLLEKVKLHLKCLEVYEKLVTYPPREYKPAEADDKKKKKEPPKKKKKKEAPFPTPEWAKSSKEVKEAVEEYKELMKIGDQIGFREDFLAKQKDIVARFVLEINFRKKEEEELRLIEEEKAKKAKKKK